MKRLISMFFLLALSGCIGGGTKSVSKKPVPVIPVDPDVVYVDEAEPFSFSSIEDITNTGWITECQEKTTGKSFQTNLNFFFDGRDNVFSQEVVNYSSPNCAEDTEEFSVLTNYFVDLQQEQYGEGQKVDLTVKFQQIEAKSDAIANLFNQKGTCEIESWTKGQYQEVLGLDCSASADVLGQLYSENQVVYTILKFKDGQLQVGDDSTSSGLSISERPKFLSEFLIPYSTRIQIR